MYVARPPGVVANTGGSGSSIINKDNNMALPDHITADETRRQYHIGNLCRLDFQRGDKKIYGYNGITNADLMQVVLDRLKPDSAAAKSVTAALKSIKD